MIVIDADLPDRVAGVGYPDGTTVRRLEQVGCTVTGTGPLTVEPPSWRPDLRGPADLVEEVVRLEGLEDIPAVAPSAPAGRGLTPSQRRRRAIGRALAVSGHVEVLPFPFLPADVFDAWGLPADDPRRATVRVLNPLESDRSELATTLIPNLVEMAVRNITRGQRDVALYTIGQVVLGDADSRPVGPIDVSGRPTDEQIAELYGSLPRQPLSVAVVLAGNREPAGPWGAARAVDPSDAFEAARVVAEASGVTVRMVADDHLPWHPGRCARVVADGPDGLVDVGWAGELHPRVVEASGCPLARARSRSISTRSRSGPSSPRRRCRRSRPSCRTSPSSWTLRFPRRTSRMRSRTVRESCWRRSGSSTCSPVSVWVRATSPSRSPSGSGRPTDTDRGRGQRGPSRRRGARGTDCRGPSALRRPTPRLNRVAVVCIMTT